MSNETTELQSRLDRLLAETFSGKCEQGFSGKSNQIVCQFLFPETHMCIHVTLCDEDLKSWDKDKQGKLQDALSDAADVIRVMHRKCETEGIKLTVSPEPIQGVSLELLDSDWLAQFKSDLSFMYRVPVYTMSNQTPERAYEIFIETYHLMNNNLGAEPNRLISNASLENEHTLDYIDIRASKDFTENAKEKQNDYSTIMLSISPYSDLYIDVEISVEDQEAWNEVAQNDLQDLLEDASKVMINIITRCRAEGLDIFVSSNAVEGRDGIKELVDQKWMEEFKAKLLPLKEPETPVDQSDDDPLTNQRELSQSANLGL